MNTDTGQIKPFSEVLHQENWVPVSDHVAGLMSDAKEQRLRDLEAEIERLKQEAGD